MCYRLISTLGVKPVPSRPDLSSNSSHRQDRDYYQPDSHFLVLYHILYSRIKYNMIFALKNIISGHLYHARKVTGGQGYPR